MKNIITFIIILIVGNIFSQTNLKLEWEKVQNIPGEILAITQNEGSLYAYTATSIYSSNDQGKTWTFENSNDKPWHREIIATTPHSIFAKQLIYDYHDFINGTNGGTKWNHTTQVLKLTGTTKKEIFQEHSQGEYFNYHSFQTDIFHYNCISENNLVYHNDKSTKESYNDFLTNFSSYFYQGSHSSSLIIEHYYSNGDPFYHPYLNIIKNISQATSQYFLSVEKDSIFFFTKSLTLKKSIGIPFQNPQHLNTLNDILYYSNSTNEIYVSTDLGGEWTKKIIPVAIKKYTIKDQTHIIQGESNFYIGKNLNSLALFPIYPNDLKGPKDIFVMGDSIFATSHIPHILYRSFDSGLTWEQIETTGINADIIDNQLIFQGQNFVIKGANVYKQTGVDKFVFAPNYAYLSGIGKNYIIRNNTIFRSTNSEIEKYDDIQSTWISILSGKYQLFGNEKDSNQLICLGKKKMYISDDLGNNWNLISLPKKTINSLVCSNDSILIKSNKNLFASIDKGQSWTLLQSISNEKISPNKNNAQLTYFNNSFYVIDQKITKYSDIMNEPIIISTINRPGQSNIFSISDDYLGISYINIPDFLIIDKNDKVHVVKKNPTKTNIWVVLEDLFEATKYSDRIDSRINNFSKNQLISNSYFSSSKLNGLWKTNITECELGLVGQQCDDQNVNTINDQITKKCECQGTISNEQCRTTDSVALANIFINLDGANWTNNTNWLTHTRLDTWFGVTSNEAGCVISVDLPDNNLHGNIPSSILDIEKLELINLSTNNLFGCYDDEFLEYCEIVQFDFSENKALPYYGDFHKFCKNKTQIGASCNDNDFTTRFDTINANCECEGEINPCAVQSESFVKEFMDQTDGSFNIWAGISLDRNKCISKIDITSKNLSGTIPSSISKLTMLESIILRNNNLHGSIDWDWSNLSKLKNVDISQNQLTGNIPKELIEIPSMERIYLYSNNLSGCIPESFRDHFYDYTFKVYNNPKLPWKGAKNIIFTNNYQITASCDDEDSNTINDVIQDNCNCIGTKIESSCTDKDSLVLVNFYMNTNGDNWTSKTNWLSEVPLDEWEGVKTNTRGCVTSLELPDNNLRGLFPNTIVNIRFLEHLKLDNNFLEGNIPDDIENLKYLRTLSLYNNDISGSIPKSIGNLLELRTINVRDNRITGELPKEIGNLTLLQDFIAGGNKLMGEIPTSFQNLTRIQRFNLAGNKMTGTLPAWIGDLENLQYVFLKDNDFYGCIPESYANICYKLLAHHWDCRNPKLPWEGWLRPLCKSESQIGAKCDDLNPNTKNDKIKDDCSCAGEIKVESCRSLDSIALAAIYHSFGGKNWDQNDNWLSNKPFPEWYGLKTNDDGCVVSINLDNNNLIGEIPNEILEIRDLRWISMKANHIYGCFENIKNFCPSYLSFEGNIQMPWYGESKDYCNGVDQTGAPCDDLNIHTIQDEITIDCKCKGTIKPEICRNADTIALRTIYKSLGGENWKNKENWFSNKPLYEWYGIETHVSSGCISSIDLSDNNLQGIIPNQISQIKELKFLNLANNRIFGQLPPKFENLALKKLNLSNNLISGGVPNFVDNPLEELILSHNNFEGCIPAGYNKFCGLIPLDFNNNLKLPYFGDFDKICDGNTQIGAPCDDGNSATDIDLILNSCDCQGTIVSSRNLKFLNSIQILPNPNNGQFILDIEFTRTTNCEIKIYTPLGRIIYSNKLSGKNIQKSVNLSNFSKGVYFIQLSTNQGNIIKKFTIN